MDRRVELQNLLELLLGTDNVFFQPGSNVKMVYPAIVYSLDNVDTSHANNAPYRIRNRYEVIVMDRNPDSAIPKKILELPTARFSRAYPADGLNHTVITLYF